MKTYQIIITVAILAFGIALWLIPKVITWVNKRGLLAQPNHRTSHTIPTPSMGGIGIFAGLLIALPFLECRLEIVAIMLSVAILFVTGFYDDVYEIKSMVKLLIQFIIAIGLFFAGFSIHNLHGIFGIYEISTMWSFMITILFIIGVTNAFNLIDGIDGLAGGISVINSAFFGLIFILNDQFSYAMIAFALVGSILGFLKYNYHPAKIFMGDTGSLFLGLLMSVFVIKTFQTNASSEMSISLSIILVFLPVFDTLRLFLYRMSKKKSPFLADKNHLHHLVLKVVPNHAYATMIICSFHGFLMGFIFLSEIISIKLFITLLLIFLVFITTSFLITIAFITLKNHLQKVKKSIQLIVNKNKLLEKI